MATYIKSSCAACRPAPPCICSGCWTLKDMTGGASRILVSADIFGIISETFSTLGQCVAQFSVGDSFDNYSFSKGASVLIQSDAEGQCFVYIGAGQGLQDGANSISYGGQISIPLLSSTNILGTYSIPLTGEEIINGESTPLNGTATVTIS